MRRYLAAGIWLILTITATLVVWEAVGVVASDVTDRPAPVVAHHQVVVALQAGSSSTTTTLPTGVTVPTAPTRVTPPSTTPAINVVPTTAPRGQSVATGPVFNPVTTTTIASAPPATKAPTKPVGTTTTTAPAVGGSATYSSTGGVIAVACTAFDTIRLVAALPYDSFQAVVINGGPYYVEVNFTGNGANFPLYAACFFGQPFQFNQNGHTTPTGP